MKKTLIATVVVIMLLGIMIGGGCQFFGGVDNSTPESTIESFMHALKNQDTNTLTALTDVEFGEFDFEGYDAITSYEIGEITTFSDNESTAAVNISYEVEGINLDYDYMFGIKLVDDEWFITDFDISGFDFDDEEWDFDWEENPDDNWDEDIWDEEDW